LLKKVKKKYAKVKLKIKNEKFNLQILFLLLASFFIKNLKIEIEIIILR
jgi:hypothetical protein